MVRGKSRITVRVVRSRAWRPKTIARLAAAVDFIDRVPRWRLLSAPESPHRSRAKERLPIAPRKRNVGIKETALKDSQRIVNQLFG